MQNTHELQSALKRKEMLTAKFQDHINNAMAAKNSYVTESEQIKANKCNEELVKLEAEIIKLRNEGENE